MIKCGLGLHQFRFGYCVCGTAEPAPVQWSAISDPTTWNAAAQNQAAAQATGWIQRFDAMAVEITGCDSALLGCADDGSAAHEPDNAADAARIADLEAENGRLRALLSRVEEPPTDPVHSDIERTIDHLLNGRTTKDQRRGLSTATERAERVTPSADAAIGRALR